MKFKNIFKPTDFAPKYCLDIPDPNEPTEATTGLLKNWVSQLYQSPNSRNYIYKNLLGAIIKLLDYSRAFHTDCMTYDQAEAAFKLIITEYPSASVWAATYKVLEWYTRNRPDKVMDFHIENVVRQALEKKESFRDKLCNKADEFERNATDIKEHIESIKNKMEAHAQDREFTISLIETKPGHIIALGAARGPKYQTFIPKQVEPWIYMKLFTETLKELGFEDEDIEKGAGEEEYCYYYNIKVRW